MSGLRKSTVALSIGEGVNHSSDRDFSLVSSGTPLSHFDRVSWDELPEFRRCAVSRSHIA